MMPLSSIYYGFWTGLSVMGQAEAEPVMSEMNYWAAAGPWTAHQLLGIPSLHQSLKGSSKPVS